MSKAPRSDSAFGPPAATSGTGQSATICRVRLHVAAVGRLHHVHAHLDRTPHGPGDVLRGERNLAAGGIAGIDVAEDRHLELRRPGGRSRPRSADTRPRSGRGRRPPRQIRRPPIARRRRGRRVCSRARSVGRVAVLCRMKGTRPACFRQNEAAIPLCIVTASGSRGDNRRQRRSEMPQTGRQTFAVTNKVIHRHRAQTPRSVGKNPIHAYQLTGVHVVSRVSGLLHNTESSVIGKGVYWFLHRVSVTRPHPSPLPEGEGTAFAAMCASTAARVGMPAWPPRCVAFSPAAVAANRKAVGMSQP